MSHIEWFGWLNRGLCELRILDGLVLIGEFVGVAAACVIPPAIWRLTVDCPNASYSFGEPRCDRWCKRCHGTAKRWNPKPAKGE